MRRCSGLLYGRDKPVDSVVGGLRDRVPRDVEEGHVVVLLVDLGDPPLVELHHVNNEWPVLRGDLPSLCPHSAEPRPTGVPEAVNTCQGEDDEECVEG